MKINEDILTDEGKVICDLNNIFTNKNREIERLNNIINRTTKYVQSLSIKGRGCDIYEDIKKQEILKELKGEDKEW